MSAEEKKAVLDGYLEERIKVVVATNAFGMGIDKPNIRLVVHVDTPGSLENYIQEAGRAGRDRHPADCVLLYNPEDLDTQFGLLSMARIEQRDIDLIWRAILKADHGDEKPVALTVSEILNESIEPISFVEDPEEARAAKVRTAIAVLEKQGFLERDENQTKVFQVRPLVHDEEAIRALLARLDLPEGKRALWFDVMLLLLSQDQGQDNQISIDDIAELPRMRDLFAQQKKDSYARVSPYSPVFQVLNEMARPEVGLLSKDLLYSARLRIGRSGAVRRMKEVAAREHALVQFMRDAEPNPEGWVPLALRRVNQHLVSQGHDGLPDDLIRVLRALASDGRKMGRQAALLEVGYTGREHVPIRVAGSWSEIIELSELRNSAAAVLVNHLAEKARVKAEAETTLVLVDFSEVEAIEVLRGDLTLNLGAIPDHPAFIQYLLVYLHDNAVIELKNGKALISQAMSLRVLEKKKGVHGRHFKKGDYAVLLAHYSEKIFQIHVMGEYARIGTERLGAHLRLISAYFELGKAEFAARFLSEVPEVYERATGLDSYKRIVDDLRNSLQQAIVAERASTNMLVLAGPGSGKTRVVAHRCAYLLRVERVRSDRILVACFNRHAALQLRRHIFRLVGKDAFGVMIQTYHGLALRLMGRSLAGAASGDELPDFSRLLEDATKLLTGTYESESLRGEEVRDRILAGFSHILVDEYQDVDDREYAFISAIAGLKEADQDKKLTIMAVGDDDQSIYGFKGANVRFIRRFQQDYDAQEFFLVENYRSTRAIIATANRLIAKNADRMKITRDIRVNQLREGDLSGGRWEILDPVTRGKVQRAAVADATSQAEFIVSEIKRLQALDPNLRPNAFAVIARTRDDLVPIRAALDDEEIEVDWVADNEMPVSLFRVREVYAWLNLLGAAEHEAWTAADTRNRLVALQGTKEPNRWWRFLHEIWSEWAGEAGETIVPTTLVKDFFVEAIAERQRHHKAGEGVVLVTAHKAKGLEFPHVFVADGGWGFGADTKSAEEERRVYYVALTRARETLTLIARGDRRTQFVGEASGPDTVLRKWKVSEVGSPGIANRRYAIIDPKELFLSYCASMPENSLVQAAIRGASVGDSVRLVTSGKWIHVVSAKGVPIAALSEAGRLKWGPRLEKIRWANVTAMVRRTVEQEAEEYREEARVQSWEYPVVEVCWDNGP